MGIKDFFSAKDSDMVISEDTVLNVFKAINTRKTCGTDGVCGRVLKYCAKEQCAIFRFSFQASIDLCKIPFTMGKKKRKRKKSYRDSISLNIRSCFFKSFQTSSFNFFGTEVLRKDWQDWSLETDKAPFGPSSVAYRYGKGWRMPHLPY